jgi:hypothetical protein
MSTDRKAATLIGVLFIVGTVAGALSMIVTEPVLGSPDYLAQVGAGRDRMIGGVLLLLVMGFALALVPVVFWPVGRRHDETLAMGYVVFRGALETVTYLVGAIGWLLLVALSAEPGAGLLAGFVRTTERVLWEQVIAIPFILGALMFYTLLYRSRLLPRWLSGWGLVGAMLYIVAPLARMFDISADVLMAPLAVQEMVMAVWLITKGFSAPATARAPRVAAQTAQTATLAPQ